tara:strand:+ start:339 stop:710 length:372 start_codon:yes stop_codon:yes gene_type:complete
MAITFNTGRLQGLEGTTINGVYGRIQSITVKKYDATTDPDVAAHFGIMYDVVLHASAAKRNAAGEYPEWGNRLRSRSIDHFTATVTVDQMNAENANSYTLAYADLKAKLAAGDSPIATSIQDA